jgi:hypothetical protein
MPKETDDENEIRSLISNIKDAICSTQSPSFCNKLFFYNKIGLMSHPHSLIFENFKLSIDGKEMNWIENKEWNKALSETPVGYYPMQISGPKQLERRTDIDSNLFIKVFENIYLMNSKKRRCLFNVENTLLDVKMKLKLIKNLNQRVSYKLERLAQYDNRLDQNQMMVNYVKSKMKLFGEFLGNGVEYNELKKYKEKLKTIESIKENKANKKLKLKKKLQEMNESLAENISIMTKDLEYLNFMNDEMKYAADNTESYNMQIIELINLNEVEEDKETFNKKDCSYTEEEEEESEEGV